MERRLQLASSIAFLVLCLVGTALGIRELVRVPPPPPPQVANVAVPAARPPRPVYQPGERMQISGVNFAAADRTLMLVVQKGCSFCEVSMPFYQRLGADAAIAKRTRLVAVAPDEVTISQADFAKFGVRVDQVVQSSLSQIKVRGTPTAILVDRNGVIEQVLSGRLTESQEQALVDLLRATS